MKAILIMTVYSATGIAVESSFFSIVFVVSSYFSQTAASPKST